MKKYFGNRMQLSIEMIWMLHHEIGISAEILIQPYPLKQQAA